MQIVKKDTSFYDTDSEHIFIPHFEHYTSADMSERVGLKGYAPMTAKEIETEEQQDELLNDSNYVVEEKFDGTRALLYFLAPNKVSKRDLSREEYLLRSTLQSGSQTHGGYHVGESNFLLQENVRRP